MRYLFIAILFAGLGCQRNEGQYPHYRVEGVLIEKIYTPETETRVWVSGYKGSGYFQTVHWPPVYELRLDLRTTNKDGTRREEIVTVREKEFHSVQLGNTLRFERNRLVSVK